MYHLVPVTEYLLNSKYSPFQNIYCVSQYIALIRDRSVDFGVIVKRQKAYNNNSNVLMVIIYFIGRFDALVTLDLCLRASKGNLENKHQNEQQYIETDSE